MSLKVKKRKQTWKPKRIKQRRWRKWKERGYQELRQSQQNNNDRQRNDLKKEKNKTYK